MYCGASPGFAGKILQTDGTEFWADRLENIGNQFAFTTILAFLISLPVMIATEGSKWGQFTKLASTNKIVLYNMSKSSELNCRARRGP